MKRILLTIAFLLFASQVETTVGAQNFSLQPGSPAINAGTAFIAPGITACANGGAPDIGAIQSLPMPSANVNGANFTITEKYKSFYHYNTEKVG